MTMRHQRPLFLGIFLACAGLLGFAFYQQHVNYLLPCPLCVAQRIAYWLVGLTALSAAAHHPQALGRRVYSGLVTVFALAGAAVAVHHAWVIRHPHLGGCKISPEEQLLNSLPFAKWWPGMFEANGDCAIVEWTFMSLAMPDWSLMWFVFFAGLAVYLLVSRQRS